MFKDIKTSSFFPEITDKSKQENIFIKIKDFGKDKKKKNTG